jgi:hypothetical protein
MIDRTVDLSQSSHDLAAFHDVLVGHHHADLRILASVEGEGTFALDNASNPSRV